MRINNLEILDPRFIEETLDNIGKNVTNFNYRDIGRPKSKTASHKIGTNIYTLLKNKRRDTLIGTMIEISNAIYDFQVQNCPQTIKDVKTLSLVPHKEWRRYWAEYGCTVPDLEQFCAESHIRVISLIPMLSGRERKQQPKVSTSRYVSAYFLMKQDELLRYKNYKALKTVNFNPLGSKLQLMELKKQKFWKDQNATTN